MTGSLIMILIAAVPTFSLFIRIPDGSERFSELWLLGPSHKAENYPFNIKINEISSAYAVYVGVGNHLGHPAYYRVDVKLRNQTQPLPNSSNHVPSPLNPTYEFQFFLAEGKTWEAPLSFSFQGKPMFISDLLINGVTFHVNQSSTWDQERNGYHYQLFLELWLYNKTSQRFQFHNRFVGIWLNMTG
jgi:uncharacterized membrane protein